MIIVSQDKKAIINFKNLTEIYISTDEICTNQDNEEENYYLRSESVCGLYEDLGKYKTEERAKEVLQKIIKYYNSLKTNITYAISDKHYPIETKSYYEMPED